MKKREIEQIELHYDTLSLPTAQHRAGLAGLIVLIKSLSRRRIKPLPDVTYHDNGSVSLRMTEESLQTLFDDLYGAFWEKRKSKSKPLGKEVRKIRSVKPDKAGSKKSFTYEAITPKAGFLNALGMPEIWLKLWRESIWATLRGQSKTRGPYNDRARDKPASIKEDWEGLQKFTQEAAKGLLHTVNIAGSLFVGAQAKNAERVPFLGRADEAFLLNFWPVVMGVYVPEKINRKGETEFNGYVLTVPDVSNVSGFARDFPDTVGQLDKDKNGFRPKAAVISIPHEGGLEHLHHLMRLVKAIAEEGETAYHVAGVEVYHLEKRDKNIHMLTADRVPASKKLIEKYDAIRGSYKNPFFKRQIIMNLLRNNPWHKDFDRVFVKNPEEHFIGSKAEGFSRDAQRFLKTVEERRPS